MRVKLSDLRVPQRRRSIEMMPHVIVQQGGFSCRVPLHRGAGIGFLECRAGRLAVRGIAKLVTIEDQRAIQLKLKIGSGWQDDFFASCGQDPNQAAQRSPGCTNCRASPGVASADPGNRTDTCTLGSADDYGFRVFSLATLSLNPGLAALESFLTVSRKACQCGAERFGEAAG